MARAAVLHAHSWQQQTGSFLHIPLWLPLLSPLPHLRTLSRWAILDNPAHSFHLRVSRLATQTPLARFWGLGCGCLGGVNPPASEGAWLSPLQSSAGLQALGSWNICALAVISVMLSTRGTAPMSRLSVRARMWNVWEGCPGDSQTSCKVGPGSQLGHLVELWFAGS